MNVNLVRHLLTEKTQDGYELQIEYTLADYVISRFTWPVHLQHTPEEIKQYISSHNLKGGMAQSLRRWCYSGYSFNENGFFIEYESGSDLSYIDAYDRARQSGVYQSLTPLDFYLISVCRRPVPAVLKEPVSAVLEYSERSLACPTEERLLWKWVYEGHSIYECPTKMDLDYLSWVRWENAVGGPDREYERYFLFDDLP